MYMMQISNTNTVIVCLWPIENSNSYVFFKLLICINNVIIKQQYEISKRSFYLPPTDNSNPHHPPALPKESRQPFSPSKLEF